jgi:hydrogenase small subunit
VRISRRDFMAYCRNSSAALALGTIQLGRLEKAMAATTGPTVLWLQGACCTGCSVSFLNRIAPAAPKTAADVLIQTVNLAYHPNLMGAAGELAVAQAQRAYHAGGYILCVEGGVPTAFGGNTCLAWTVQGKDTTFQQAVLQYSARAAQVISIGTCASFGGVAGAGPNPTGVKGVGAVTLKNTLNIPGCPPHPDWIVWAIAALLTNSVGPLDCNNRPMALYGKTVHERCWRLSAFQANQHATQYGQDNLCLFDLGCHGPQTQAACPATGWNNMANWCVDANATCLGCTSPAFPFASIRKTSRNVDD